MLLMALGLRTLVLLVVFLQLGDSFPQPARSRRHVDGMFASEYSRIRGSTAIRKLINSVLAGKSSESHLKLRRQLTQPSLAQRSKDLLQQTPEFSPLQDSHLHAFPGYLTRETVAFAEPEDLAERTFPEGDLPGAWMSSDEGDVNVADLPDPELLCRLSHKSFSQCHARRQEYLSGVQQDTP
ncbi:secretin [Rhinatrema bivittatum]|uniref:secretin n=1 Tax=Rhinatrema bivittatum TaxID=194408 RepID=UPI00112D1945|nr:secretin [Rhinatrema bivittatum]XP_029441217.1 secretin [Rhinatrema bivittatum]